MKKCVIIIVIIALLAAAAVGVVGFILFKNYNTQKTREKYDSVASSYTNTEAPEATESTEAAATESGGKNQETTAPAKKAQKNPVSFTELKKRNPDIYAWIKVPETNVDYPVLQSPNNDNFYIDHDLDRNYAFAGSIYSQMCNKLDFQDRVTLLYGHNMLDGSMFATLHRYSDSGFFDKNKTFTVYTPSKKLEYTVVSALEFDDRHIMNSYKFDDDKAYERFIDEIMKPHSVNYNVRSGENVTVNDKLLVLSTCLDYGDGRYLVVGKLTKQTELQ